MKTFIKKLLSFIKLCFCEKDRPSSKRVIAGLIFLTVLFCTTWCCIKYGMIDNVKDVIEFEIVTGGALLGVTTIANIWKTPNNEEKKEEKEEEM